MYNGSIDFPYRHFRSESALRAGVLLWHIFPPFLLLVGTVGNVLSVIVLSRKSMDRSVTNVYLMGLAFADLSVLYVGLPRQWISYLFGVDFRTTADWVCKIHFWLLYVTLDFSVWLLVMVTFERLETTFKPFSNKILCTRRRAKISIAIIGITDLVFNAHILFGMELTPALSESGTLSYNCGPSETYRDFYSSVWHYVDLCTFSLILFFTLSLRNLGIIFKVVSNNRKMKRRVAPSTSTTTRDLKASAMSKLLVTLNFVFIITTAPVCVYLIGGPYWIPEDVPRKIQQEDPWWAFVNILLFLNNSLNFILYCFSGSKFRRELKQLFLKDQPSVELAVMNRQIGI